MVCTVIRSSSKAGTIPQRENFKKPWWEMSIQMLDENIFYLVVIYNFMLSFEGNAILAVFIESLSLA